MYQRTNPASLDSKSDSAVPESVTLNAIETQSRQCRYGYTLILPRFPLARR